MNRSSLIGHLLELLEGVGRSPQPADRVVSEFFRSRKYLGSHDRRFISDCLFSIIRHRRLVETILERYCAEHPSHLELTLPALRALPLYAAFACYVEAQPMTEIILALGSRWQMTFPSISLERYVKWLSDRKASEQRVGFALGVQYSFQDWMVREWQDELGEEAEALLRALNDPATVTLRVNLLKTTREDCRRRLAQEGIETEETQFSPAGLIAKKRFSLHSSAAFQEGWFELQDEGSQIVSLVAAPAPGSIVVDACAGAGGKALHLAQLMRDDGEIVAVDVERARLSKIHERTSRAGIQCIKPMHRDNLQPETLAGKADLVLVDAPCSGVGTIRRNPWFKWSVTQSLVDHYAGLQGTILELNSQFVKRGGALVYTTCSLLRQENENVVESFLENHHDFKLVNPAEQSARYGLQAPNAIVKLFPHMHGTDGFCIARLLRER